MVVKPKRQALMTAIDANLTASGDFMYESRNGPFVAQSVGMYWNQTQLYPTVIWAVSGTATTSMSTTRSWTEVKTSTDTVRRAKPKGRLIYYSANMTNRSYSVETHRVGLKWENTGNYGPGPLAGKVIIDARDKTKTDLQSLRGLHSDVQSFKWNAATFIGEFPETAEFFRDSMRAVVKSYIAVKRGDLHGLYKAHFPKRFSKKGKGKGSYRGGDAVVDKSADLWMQWRYAIRPLMFDLKDMLNYLYEQRTQSYFHKSEGYSKFAVQRSVKSTTLDNWNENQKYTVAYTVWTEGKPSDSQWQKLGVTNPLALLYELTPLSFVLDWFIPFGEYIASLDTFLGITVVGSTKTTKETTMREVSGKAESWSPPFAPYTVNYSPSVSNYKAYNRSVSPALSLPVPTLELSLTAERLLDAVSLSRNLMRKAFHRRA